MRITRMAFSSCIEGRAGFDRTCVGTSVASDGAEQDAYMTVDAKGVPFAGGG